MEDKTGILLSGGMDSVALAYWKRPKYAFTVDYGQKPAQAEIHAAKQVCLKLGIEHHIIKVDCSTLGSGDLSERESLDIAPIKEWWPYRNQLLVTLSCMKAISLGVKKMLVGSVFTDDCHIDGTKEFYHQLSDLVSMQEGNMVIEVPANSMTTYELIKTSGIPNSLLLWAHSCHTSNQPCMNCNGCRKYHRVLQQLGLD